MRKLKNGTIRFKHTSSISIKKGDKLEMQIEGVDGHYEVVKTSDRYFWVKELKK